jgi:1-phosphatidylinositol phosphodiesterase
MLNAGIRVFDIRYALDVTNSTLNFWHSQALLSQTATVNDVMFGFYTWLSDHPSEALMLSFQYEGSTTLHGINDADVQLQLFDLLTSPAAKQYILQTQDQFGTLGEARGKITLLKRFDMDQLPASFSDLPGVHFSPALWTDDSPDITLVYNTAENLTAYIEDFYETDSAIGSSAEFNIQLKYNATVAHLNKAATQFPDSLFWSFASSEYDINVPIDTPEIMAIGNGTEFTPLGGVNQRLASYFKTLKGKRLGIVMFDYFDVPSDLVDTFLAIN